MPATLAELGIRRQRLHEARKLAALGPASTCYVSTSQSSAASVNQVSEDKRSYLASVGTRVDPATVIIAVCSAASMASRP